MHDGRLKHDDEFTWGAEQKEAFRKIKEYLMNPPVLKELKVRQAFKLYVAAQSSVVGAVLMQEEGRMEYIIAYVSRCLLDAETRYAYIEKFCLSLYHSCTKFRHYILLSVCVVVCHHDVIKYKLHRPILSGRFGKWAYLLIEYDLLYEPLQAVKGQVVTDFIVDHSVNVDDEACSVEAGSWELFFDGSVNSRGQGVGCVLVSPSGMMIELAT
jgi:hypothetical protein